MLKTPCNHSPARPYFKILLFAMKFALTLLLVLSFALGNSASAQNWKLFGGNKKNKEATTEVPDTVAVEPVDTVVQEPLVDDGHIPAPDTSQSGVIEIYQDYRIRQLLDKQIYINDSTGTIKGYRVQLWFGSGAGSATKAKEVEAEFLGMHPDVPTYRPYEKAAFRLKAGNFRTRMQAQKFHEEVREYFPAAFIIEDRIELPELPK